MDYGSTLNHKILKVIDCNFFFFLEVQHIESIEHIEFVIPFYKLVDLSVMIRINLSNISQMICNLWNVQLAKTSSEDAFYWVLFFTLIIVHPFGLS